MKTEYYIEWKDGRKWRRSGEPISSKAKAIRECRERGYFGYFVFNSACRYRVVCVVTEEVLREVLYETKDKKR